jgi:hypothetical protein
MLGSMKIGGTRQANAAGAKRAGPASSSSGGFFADGAEALRGVAGLGSMPSLAAVDALLALQETPVTGDALSGKRRAVIRGEQMLDILDDIKVALLSGQVSQGKLNRLVQVLDAQKGRLVEPKLADLLGQIELRAYVELAKFGTFPKI